MAFEMSLVNKAALKKFILDYARDQRRHVFTRVSSGSLQTAEAMLRNWAQNEIHRHPSVGKTLRLGGGTYV